MPPPAPKTTSDIAILAMAAGRGLRAGAGPPKQYRLLAGRPLLGLALENLIRAAPGARILPVIHPDDRDVYMDILRGLPAALIGAIKPPAFGGHTRQASVKAGLDRFRELGVASENIVLIHDAARPFVSDTLAKAAIAAARQFGAAIPGTPVSDTIKQVDANGNVVATPPRQSLRAVQTPQAFRMGMIHDAHLRAAAAGIDDLTDDAAVVEWAGHRVHVFQGDPANMKVTTTEDFAIAEARMLTALPDVRVGQGFDVHAFCPGDHVWLGGARIPHDHGLEGHSDADVLLHAITDALLGALADGDIGSHFPPSDPRWKGASSDIFLRHALDLTRARGGVVAHVDATILCEAPKVGPHRDAIRARIAELLELHMDRVAVKATTTERLGFTGRREGIAAMAIATLRLPLGATGQPS